MFFKLSFLATVALSSSLPIMATSITQPQNVQQVCIIPVFLGFLLMRFLYQCVGHAFSVSGTPPFDVYFFPGCDQDSTSETPLLALTCTLLCSSFPDAIRLTGRITKLTPLNLCGT